MPDPRSGIGVYRLLSTLFIAWILTACDPSVDGTPPAGPAEETASTTLHRGNLGEPGTLDPHRSGLVLEWNILFDLFEGLVVPDANGNLMPGAALSWTASDDKRTWTFTLRDHLWSDGTPVKASDVVFGVRRALDPNTAARYVDTLYFIENAAAVNRGDLPLEALGVDAPDDKTVVFRLRHPVPNLPQALMGFPGLYTGPIPEHVVTDHGDDWTKPEHMITNGAYTLGIWEPNNFVRLQRNPIYHDADAVNIETVLFHPTDDLSTAFRRYRAGELDLTLGIETSQYQAWKDQLGDQIRNHELLSTVFLAFNMRDAPFDDLRVRRAVSLSIDRTLITEDLRGLGERIAQAFTPAATRYGNARPALDFADLPRESALTEARTLLADAGYTEDNPLSFELRYTSGERRKIAIAIQAMLKEAGIEADIFATEAKTHYSDLDSGNYQVAMATWVSTVNDPAYLLRYLGTQVGRSNMTGYASAAFAERMAAADQLTDEEARFVAIAEAEQILLNDLPVLPLFYQNRLVLVGPHVQGFNSNPQGFNLTRWLSIDETARP